MENRVEITGVIRTVTFQNAENGYLIARCEGEGEGGGVFTAVGTLPGARVGGRYAFVGDWTSHPKYGEQFQFRSCEEIPPASGDEIETFLASGAIRGVGPKMARSIVERFGDETLAILENDPQQLLSIDGIGEKKLESIVASFAEHRQFAEIVLFFRQYDISPDTAMRLYRSYGAETIASIRENPYRIIDDLHGVGFRKADVIALKMGVSENSAHRVRSGVLYVLGHAASDGHTCLPKQGLVDSAVALMDVSGDEIEDAVFSLILEGRVDEADVSGTRCVFPGAFFFAERKVCGDLLRLMGAQPRAILADTDDLIRGTEHSLGITLSDSQRDAVRRSIENGVFVITGGPGTGKTTIIRAVLDIFAHCGLRTAVAAPTGRAARRITETTGSPASTIHRLLEYSYEDDTERMYFGRNAEKPLEADAVVIDEASMIDVLLMNALLAAIPTGARLIVVGDADQLPSVGAGNVLGDMLDSEQLPGAASRTSSGRQGAA